MNDSGCSTTTSIEVDEKSEIKVDVAIVPDARDCPGVKAGGIVELRARKIKVICKANAIPDFAAGEPR